MYVSIASKQVLYEKKSDDKHEFEIKTDGLEHVVNENICLERETRIDCYNSCSLSEAALREATEEEKKETNEVSFLLSSGKHKTGAFDGRAEMR